MLDLTFGTFHLRVVLDSEAMHCKSCGSEGLRRFNGEVAIHFPGLEGLDQPIVWIFPELLICLECGTAQFEVPEQQLRMLNRGAAAAGSS